MKSIVLTLDYELYGNGSGDVFRHVIIPTDKILKIAGRYNARITFFFEVVEYWKLKKEWERGNSMGYDTNPVAAIEDQLKHAYREGHDIQLHLHPQWVDAVYVNRHWKVNLDEWRLGGYKREGEFSLVHLLEKGKKTLENIIQSIDPGYQCIALRAGGYNIQPSQEIVKAMRAAHLYIDSSIFPGGKECGTLSRYDYSDIPVDAGFWNVGTELEKPGKSGIMELPIVAFPLVRWKKYLTMERIKSLLRNRESAKDAFEAKTGGDKGKWRKIKFFLEEEWQTWDYCLFSKSMHRQFLKAIEKQSDRNVFTLVGHPKSFVSGKGLEYLLGRTRGKYSCITISQFIKSL